MVDLEIINDSKTLAHRIAEGRLPVSEALTLRDADRRKPAQAA